MPSIIIIGAGMGGLAAGIYSQSSGFETAIFEAHTLPGGQCTSWKRKGFTFDGCLHHLGAGSSPSRFNQFWKEVGVLPCEMVPTREVASAVTSDGTYFHDYYDLELLETHLKELSPPDADLINEYLDGIQVFREDDRFSKVVMGSLGEKLSFLPVFLRHRKYFQYSMGTFGERFQHPLLRRAFPLLHASLDQFPFFMHLVKHAYALKGDLAWPRGGSMTVARNMAARYQELGGELNLKQKVVRILTEDDRACGVELEDGTRQKADFVISNADGRKTIQDLLSGEYMDENTTRYCQPNPDQAVPWSVGVFLGVKRDLSSQSSSLIQLLEKPVVIAGEVTDHLQMQIYGYDSSMAPPGKGVIKVELFSKPSYFAALQPDRDAYQAEKERIADQVIRQLEHHFPGLAEDVEVVDVTTLHSWERYMGGTQGFNNFPNQVVVGDEGVISAILGFNQRYTLPGLDKFYFAGSWATSTGALISNALSGKSAVQKICRESGMDFQAPEIMV